MRIEIEIPKEFEEHFKQDKFEEALQRLNADAHLVAGNYDKETTEMLIKAFKESKPADCWIPCIQTLPEKYEYVLVWCKGYFTSGTCVGEECQWYGIGYVCGDKWTVYQCKDIDRIEVVGWQPLPKPYQEGAYHE